LRGVSRGLEKPFRKPLGACACHAQSLVLQGFPWKRSSAPLPSGAVSGRRLIAVGTGIAQWVREASGRPAPEGGRKPVKPLGTQGFRLERRRGKGCRRPRREVTGMSASPSRIGCVLFSRTSLYSGRPFLRRLCSHVSHFSCVSSLMSLMSLMSLLSLMPLSSLFPAFCRYLSEHAVLSALDDLFSLL
jgi:hypothetical protein